MWLWTSAKIMDDGIPADPGSGMLRNLARWVYGKALGEVIASGVWMECGNDARASVKPVSPSLHSLRTAGLVLRGKVTVFALERGESIIE